MTNQKPIKQAKPTELKEDELDDAQGGVVVGNNFEEVKRGNRGGNIIVGNNFEEFKRGGKG